MSSRTVREAEVFIWRAAGMVPSWPSLRLSAASRFRGRFVLPGDKSLCHRLAILGALAEGETRASNFSTAADCDSTLRCLGLLGVETSRQSGTVTVTSSGVRALTPELGTVTVHIGSERAE